MEHPKDRLEEELKHLRKQLAEQEERLKGKANLLSKIQNEPVSKNESGTPNDTTTSSKEPQIGNKLSSTDRKMKKKGFKMYSPVRRKSSRNTVGPGMAQPSPSSKRTHRDVNHPSNEFVDPNRTLSFGSMSRALERNLPEEIYVVKKRKAKTPKLLLSKDEQYRNQVNLINQKYHTLGNFVMNLLSQVYQDNERMDPLTVQKDGVMEKVFLCSENSEIVEKTRWLDELTRILHEEQICPSNIASSDLFFLDQISDRLYEIVATKCTFNMSLFKTIEPRICILGPRESGKTTVLHLITRSVMDIYLNETNQWQTCFLWIVNWKNLSFPSLDIETLYRMYIRKILKQLSLQKPAVAPYRKHLEKMMTDFSKGGPVPLSFSNDWRQEYLMLRIFKDKAKRLLKERKFNDLLGFIVTLPYHISQVFGFRNILNVYDNFDYTFVKLLNSTDDSGKSTNYFSVYLKSVLMEQKYIVTGKDMRMFVKCMKVVKPLKKRSSRRRGSPQKKKKKRRRSSKKGNGLNSSLNTSLNLSGEIEVMDEDESDGFMKSVLLSTENLVDPEEVEDLPKAITLVNTNLYTEYQQTQMISIENFRGCPAYLAHVIRFVHANPSTSEIMKSTPMPEQEVKKILSDVVDHRASVGDVADKRYHLKKSLHK